MSEPTTKVLVATNQVVFDHCEIPEGAKFVGAPYQIPSQSKDAEGNTYSQTGGLSFCQYKPETNYYGEVGLTKLTSRLKAQGFSEEDVMTDGIKAVVLYPMN